MQSVFLGVIAVATLVMALVQVGLIIFAARLARKVDHLVAVIETEIKPTLGRVNTMSGDMTRVTALAVAQVERVDQLLERVVDRTDRVTLVAQDALIRPVQQGVAVFEGVRAALAALRDAVGPSAASRSKTDTDTSVAGKDEEALFIG